jgi:maltooligosyltrehalose trehalohydrolase
MQFPGIARPEIQAVLADPAALHTFERCKLDLSERVRHSVAYGFHRDLLQLRRNDRVLSARDRTVEGAVLGPHAFVLRFFTPAAGDRLLIINLGPELILDIAPEPLLAPNHDSPWRTVWCSDAEHYGGEGALPLEWNRAWRIPAEAAVMLAPERHVQQGR